MHSSKSSQAAGRRRWACLLPAVLLCGCSGMRPTDKGVRAGGGLGAGLGALIGHSVGHTGAGALIGTGLGAVAGGVTGSAVEHAERTEAAAAAQAARAQLGLTDVVSMAQQGVADDVLIRQIPPTGSAFRLSSSDVVYLTQNHVSDRVIQAMQDTAHRPRYVVPAYQPVYVVGPPPPPPPVSVGFGIGFCR